MSNKMWGGRFAASSDELMQEINSSIDFDKNLYAQDIRASMAHAKMLAKCKIISERDRDDIIKGLEIVKNEIEQNKFKFSRELEDIHMNIEARLSELIGEAAGRLHTARSRNDQVATDFKLYIRDMIDLFVEQIEELQKALIIRAEQEVETIMPGFTHLQSAQPVSFAHHLLAYIEMLNRDKKRFLSAKERLNECPLGCAALAGTSFAIDREMVAKELGFDRPNANSLDGVSDRDFVLDILGAASICAMHLSRFSEELVIWSSAQFDFITFSDKFSTGSSIMPQKRNPDAAELIRAKIGRINAAYNSLMMVMKALPLAYSKDMQEDKELSFDALNNFSLCLSAMKGMILDFSVNREKMKIAANSAYSTATDIADWLVRKANVPFREAHHITGQIVALAERKKLNLNELNIGDMQKIDNRINSDIFSVLSVENSVNSRTSFGGTAPENIKAQIEIWKNKLQIS